MTETKKKSKLKTVLTEDIMTDDVSVIKEDMLIGQAAHLMLRHRISGYPIVDDDKKVVGIITLTDLFVLIDKIVKESDTSPQGTLSGSLEEKLSLCKNMPVSSIMTKNVLSIAPKTPLIAIIETVVNTNLHTFPVMENNKLVGIIGRHDVLNATFVYG